MPDGPYPVDIRVDRPETSSRLWAVLTILLIKFLALIPHAICLAFLGIAQFFVFFAAQVVVVIRGEYPPSMFDMVAGVMRWSTRVSAFVFSLSDVYPPFSLREDASYPIDVVLERPARSSRLYALFTLIVFVATVAIVVAVVWFVVAHWSEDFASSTGTTSNGGSSSFGNYNFNFSGQNSSFADLTLRGLAVIPHQIVLLLVGIAAFVLWVIVQWVILFTSRFPQGMYDFVAGYVRWSTRVRAYTLGLTERYPPFNMQPSLVGPGALGGSAPLGGWPLPPAPPLPAPPLPAGGGAGSAAPPAWPQPPATGYQPAPAPLPTPEPPQPAAPEAPTAPTPPDEG